MRNYCAKVCAEASHNRFDVPRPEILGFYAGLHEKTCVEKPDTLGDPHVTPSLRGLRGRTPPIVVMGCFAVYAGLARTAPGCYIPPEAQTAELSGKPVRQNTTRHGMVGRRVSTEVEVLG